ncbi:hypothetical protein [Lacrimispora sp.]|uniref:hypothetical protein n=1 Tax=Lacrimispora sp. TaxID=2719234 RepID=UPI0028A23211|nr:hypothetical protein [Lacrimispora sp.]
MEFKITEKELWVLNQFLKSITIKNSLFNYNTQVDEKENTEIIRSLCSKSLLYQDSNGNFNLAKEIKPYQKVFDFSDSRILHVIDVEENGESAVEMIDIFSVKKGHIGIFSGKGENICLKFFNISDLNSSLIDFMGIEGLLDDLLPPFLITVPLKQYYAFYDLYDEKPEEAISQYAKVFGVSKKQLEMIVSILWEDPTKFIVEVKGQTKGLYHVFKKDGICLVAHMDVHFLKEVMVISHRPINEFIKWLGIRRKLSF